MRSGSLSSCPASTLPGEDQKEWLASSKKIESELVPWFPLSWTFIIFGAFVALAMTVLLHSVGLDLFVTLIDPDSATTGRLEKLGVSNVFLIISAIFVLFVAALVANTVSRMADIDRERAPRNANYDRSRTGGQTTEA